MPDVPTSNSSPESQPRQRALGAGQGVNPLLATASNLSRWSHLTWQKQLSRSYRSVSDLTQAVGIELRDLPENKFPVMVPESFVARMAPGDPEDPLLKQVLTTAQENTTVEGFRSDPVGDSAAKKADGLLQKYEGRALLITTGSCAVHCRYCFRRDYPYQTEPKTLADWQPALNAIRTDTSISEVILSGGDPLLLTDLRLRQLTEALDSIPHIDRIRIHTRLPIVLPARITNELLHPLKTLRAQVVWVVHSNHANEIQNDCKQALQTLVQTGFVVLNQAVLLKGVNDDFQTLRKLCLSLVNIGVMPYYLHQLDRVTGAAHFEVPVDTGRRLIEQLKAVLPGYAVPKFVQEIEGETSKTALTT